MKFSHVLGWSLFIVQSAVLATIAFYPPQELQELKGRLFAAPQVPAVVEIEPQPKSDNEMNLPPIEDILTADQLVTWKSQTTEQKLMILYAIMAHHNDAVNDHEQRIFRLEIR